MPDASPTIGLRVVESLSAVDADQWDACALAPGSAGNPFLSYGFLKALEDSKSVGRRTGWQPQYLLAEAEDGTLLGAAPLYLKGHSQGEYVFDHGWAQAFERAGGRYYPKLQVAVPFTPVPGPRLFVRPGAYSESVCDAMIDMLAKIAGDNRISSVHATYCTEADWKRFGEHGWLLRLGRQYHWHNNGYGCFDDFLAALASRKRKAIRKERESVRREGLSVRALCGDEIKPEHWDAFFAFYMDTGGRKWGSPYLTRSFFDILGIDHGRQGRAGDGRGRRPPGRRRAQPQGRRHALRPLLGLPGEPRLPAFRGLLLPGDRLRHRPWPAARRGRRPGRPQDPTRLSAGADLLGPLDRRSRTSAAPSTTSSSRSGRPSSRRSRG